MRFTCNGIQESTTLNRIRLWTLSLINVLSKWMFSSLTDKSSFQTVHLGVGAPIAYVIASLAILFCLYYGVLDLPTSRNAVFVYIV